MPSVTLIVLIVAQQGGDPSSTALERTARRALGPDAKLEIVRVASDPPDEQSVARAASADGLVELTWSSDGTKALLHCYLRRDARWLDREIKFGTGTANPEREANERGRMLGFAIATMFGEEAEETKPPVASTATETGEEGEAPRDVLAKPQVTEVRAISPTSADEEAPTREDTTSESSSTEPFGSIELSGIASSGIDGDGGGIGAAAAFRATLAERLALRLFVAGRSGNLPRAQASTLTGMGGPGLALSLLPPSSRAELGVRLDLFASYFVASHLSPDDPVPDKRARWLPGGAFVLEGGWHLSPRTSLIAGAGLEVVGGRTDVYTHGKLVAQASPWRIVGEFGFKSRF